MFNITYIMDDHNFNFMRPYMTLIDNINVSKLDYRDDLNSYNFHTCAINHTQPITTYNPSSLFGYFFGIQPWKKLHLS